MVESLDAERRLRGDPAATPSLNGRFPSGSGSPPIRKLVPLVGGAFGAGFALAKIIDWRGHAHPRG